MNSNFEKSDQIKIQKVDQFLINKIESLPIRDFDKVDLILLLAGLKIAVEINVPKNNDNWKNAIKDMDLYFIEDKEMADGNKRKFYIGRSQEDAEKLHNAFMQGDDKEAGILSGYPTTAVENYAKTTEDLRNPNLNESDVVNLLNERFAEIIDLPMEEQQRRDLLPFGHFRLSRENWEQEVEVVKRWAETVGSLDPGLYSRIKEYYRK